MVRALLTGLLVLGGTAAAQARGGATAFFSETVKDFGATPRGPILVHYFTLKNTTNAPLNLGQPRVSCGCVSASIVNNKAVVPPGDTAVIAAQMDTRRIPQANVIKSVIVYVPIVSPFLEEVQLRVQAIARDDLVLTPDTLAMGTVRKGQGGKASVRLTCYSDAVDICFNPHTLSAMRIWLKQVYGSIENLNRQWGTNFTDWNAVEPDDALLVRRAERHR